MDERKAKPKAKGEVAAVAAAAPRNAPPGGNIQALAGNAGPGGAGLFALDPKGRLWLNAQTGPGGGWVGWVGGGTGQPVPGQALAAASDGYLTAMLAMIDLKGMVWTWATTGRGGWGDWVGPGVGGQQFSFTRIAAGAQSDGGGFLLVATDADGEIWACRQIGQGGQWSGWTNGVGISPAAPPSSSPTSRSPARTMAA